MRLIPLYKEYQGPYVVYWDALSPDQWKAKEAEYEAELAREKALAARTVDQVQIGDDESEQAHQLQGEKTGAGDFSGRHWRHAIDGGWFSYVLKVQPGQPLELRCTYWGSDVGNRVFDILVDDTKVATQKLDRNRPDEFLRRSLPDSGRADPGQGQGHDSLPSSPRSLGRRRLRLPRAEGRVASRFAGCARACACIFV